MSIFDATEVELEHSNTNKNVERSNPSRTQQKRRATNESNAPNASNAANASNSTNDIEMINIKFETVDFIHNSSESKSSLPPSPSLPSTPSKLCLLLQHFRSAAIPLILFWLLIIGIFSLLFLSCSFGSQQESTNDMGRIIFRILPLQLVFYVGIMITLAEVVMRAASNSKGILNTRCFVLLGFLFGIIITIILVFPSISTIKVPPITQVIERGNCSNAIRWNELLDDSCPVLFKSSKHPLFLYPEIQEQILQEEETQEDTIKKSLSMKSESIQATFKQIYRIIGSLPLFSTLSAHYKMTPEYLDGIKENQKKFVDFFFEKECTDYFADWLCSRAAPPCRFENCEPINATLCSSPFLTSWLQCAKDKCSASSASNSGCNPEQFNSDLFSNYLQSFYRDLFTDKTKLPSIKLAVKNALNPQELSLSKRLWSFVQKEVAQLEDLKHKYNPIGCIFNNKISNVTSVLSCDSNPNITKVLVDTGNIERNGGKVLIAVFLMLTMIVGVSATNGIAVPAPHTVTVFVGGLGIVTALMVFVGAINIERYAFSSIENRSDLEIWSGIYYFVSLLAFHHSLFMFLPDEWMFTVSTMMPFAKKCWYHNFTRKLFCKKPKKKRHKHSPHYRRCCPKLMWFQKNVRRKGSKYFILYMWSKELVQIVQQLVGIANSCGETEAFSVLTTGLLVCFSSVILPVFYHIVLHCSGPTLADATNIFLNSFIDKFYILFSVFVRKTETAVAGRNFGEALLRHSLTLFPALMFARSQNYLYVLQQQYNEHSQQQLVQSSVTSVHSRSKLKHNRESQRRSSLVLQQHSITMKLTNIVGALSILIGLGFGSYTIVRYISIRNRCREKLGILADCASPRYYFKNGFFIGDTTCAIEDYQRFDCANGSLGDTENLLDNSSLYANMTSLTHIDCSGNTHLVSLPSSWSSIPLKVINGTTIDLVVKASRNPSLKQVPFILCKENSNIDIDASNSAFANHVDWSGQIRSKPDTSTEIKYRSENGGNCNIRHPCGMCEADCDNDDECIGGLRCAQRVYENVIYNIVGCTEKRTPGTATIPEYSWDVCHDPNINPIRLSPSCQNSISRAHSLDLSDCDLSCPKKVFRQYPKTIGKRIFVPLKYLVIEEDPNGKSSCTFHNMIGQMRNLSFLDLSNNSLIESIESLIISATHHIVKNNISRGGEGGGLQFLQNNIVLFNFVGQPKDLVNHWFKIMTYNPMERLTHGTFKSVNMDDQEFIQFELFKLKHLKYIDVSFCQKISDLNLIVPSFPPSLEGMDLYENTGIVKLDQTPFQTMTKLLSLRLIWREENLVNGLTKIEPGVFEGLSSLLFLCIESRTSKVVLNANTFLGMPLLSELQLSGGVAAIKKNAFQDLKNVLILQISFNVDGEIMYGQRIRKMGNKGQLTSIPNGAFSGLSNIIWLSLAYNSFQKGSIDPQAFANMNPTGMHSMVICAPRTPKMESNTTWRVFTDQQRSTVLIITGLNVSHNASGGVFDDTWFSTRHTIYEGVCPQKFRGNEHDFQGFGVTWCPFRTASNNNALSWDAVETGYCV